jgi:hypothetical protein
MSARAAIENSLALYAWAFDMDEMERMGECFTEDAEVHFVEGFEQGRDDVVANLKRRREGFRGRHLIPWHLMTNVLITAESDDHAEVTCFYTFFTRSGNDVPQLSSIGYYADHFVRDGDVWRVRRRRIVAGGGPTPS